LLRIQIVDTAFSSETRTSPGVQSGRPSVNRTVVTSIPSKRSTSPEEAIGSDAFLSEFLEAFEEGIREVVAEDKKRLRRLSATN
jgi:hypothetical protein